MTESLSTLALAAPLQAAIISDEAPQLLQFLFFMLLSGALLRSFPRTSSSRSALRSVMSSNGDFMCIFQINNRLVQTAFLIGFSEALQRRTPVWISDY